MTRRAELAGIIRPEVSERDLEQEAQQMESRFSEAAQLTPDIDTRSIQRQLEQAVPGGGIIGTAIDAVSGRGGSDSGGATAGAGDAVPSTGTSLQAAQLEQLEDIHDELEKLGASGGADGGGGGMSGGSLIGKAAAALGPPSIAAGGAGLALSPGIFGRGSLYKGGEGKTGPIFGALTGTRGQSKKEATKTIRKDLTGSEEPPLKDGISKPEWLSELTTTLTTQPEWIPNLSVQQPAWVEDLTSAGIQEPTWVTDLTELNVQEPAWMQDLTSSAIPEPGWVQDLQTSLDGIQIQEPGWLDSLSEVGVNLNVDLPAPKLDIGTGQLESQIRTAFDDFRDEIVDEVLQDIESQFGGP